MPDVEDTSTDAPPEEQQAEEAESYGLDLDNLHIYGYFSVRLEKVFSEPSIHWVNILLLLGKTRLIIKNRASIAPAFDLPFMRVCLSVLVIYYV